MPRRSSLLTAVGILLVSGVTVRAQSVQTGEVIGVVLDEAKRPIAGAIIRAKSNQVERTFTSNAKGEYKLPLLNVGRWSLTVTKDGFQVATVALQVNMHETRMANFSLVPTQGAVVEVIAKLGNLDTTSTQVGVNLSGESLKAIPMDMTSMNALDGLMSSVPGVRVATTGVFQIMGGSYDQNAYVVDGNLTNQTSTNSSTTNGSGASVQPAREFIESVEVVTNGFGAEYGAFGGVVNALTKSGSNTTEGGIFYGTNFPNSAALPFYQDKWTPTLPRTRVSDHFQRYGFTLSGPIIKDKLFYFVGFQDFKDDVPPTTLLTGSTNWNGLKSDNAKVSGPNQWTAKLNWYIDTNNQLILSATRSHYKSNTGHQYTDYGNLDTGSFWENTQQTVNLTWNWLPSSNLYVVASVGQFKNPSKGGPISGAAYPSFVVDGRYFLTGPGSLSPNIPSNPEYAVYQTGTGASINFKEDNPNNQYRLDLTWTLGRHQIKVGYLRQETSSTQSDGGEEIWVIDNDILSPYSADYLNRLRWTPSYSKYYGVLQSQYLKDVVTLGPGLSLDVGVRYDSYVYKGGADPFLGMHLAEYNHPREQLQPRFGLIWDVDQDGKKKVYAHYGRFFMTMPMNAVSWAKTSGIYYDMWFPGSWSYNATYPGGNPISLVSPTPDFSMMLAGGVGLPQPHATKLRLPRKNTLTIGADWTLSKGWSVGGNWTFWELKDVLEDSYFLNADGSAAFSELQGTKVIWNPGPGQVDFVDSNGVRHSWTSNFPEPKDRYIGLNVHTAYQGERDSLIINYTWTHHYGNYQGETQNYLTYIATNNQTAAGSNGRTKEYDYANGIATGNMEGDPVHELKVQEAHRFTLLNQDINLAITAVWQSGVGLTSNTAAGGRWVSSAATASNFGGNPSDFVTVNNQRGDMGNASSNLMVNADISASIKLGGSVSIRPNVSIVNIFNKRTVLGVNTRKYTGNFQSDLQLDPNYGLAISALTGRMITAGLAVRF